MDTIWLVSVLDICWENIILLSVHFILLILDLQRGTRRGIGDI